MRLAPFIAILGTVLSYSPAVSAKDLVIDEPERLRVFAECTIKEQRTLAINLALRERASAGRLGTRSCAKLLTGDSSDSVNVPPVQFAGTVVMLVAEKLELSRIDGTIASAPPLKHAKIVVPQDYEHMPYWPREEFERLIPWINTQRLLDIGTECAVRRSPQPARIFFMSNFDSSAEDEAFSAFNAVFKDCTMDTKPKYTLRELRYATAISYLRLAVAADPSLKEKLL